MGFYWIGFTLIWITFYQKEITSAASLRSELLDFSPDAIDITKSHTEKNLPVENSNYYLKNHGNQKHRTRLPYERRNRQIYTSKTFFGRNQQLELPKKYWINKEDTDTTPLRTKTARYMYPVSSKHLVPQKYENTAVNHEHIPHLSHQIPTVPVLNTGDTNSVNGLKPNYNLGNAARIEYDLNSEHDLNAGYEQNPHNNVYVKHDLNPEQNANFGFGQVPTYQVNAEYPEYYGHGGHGQDPVYHGNGMSRDLGYAPNVEQKQVLANGPNIEQRQVLGYGPNDGHGQVLGHGPNVGDGQVLGYGPDVGHGQALGHGPNVGHGQVLGYGPSVEHRQVLEHDPNVGHGQVLGHGPNVGDGQVLGYGPSVEHRQVLEHDPSIEHRQVLGHGITAGNEHNPGYDASVGNRHDPRYANAGQGQDPGYFNHAQQGQDHGYNTATGNRQKYGHSTNFENGHDSGQNVYAAYGSNVKKNANGYGHTNYESKEIKSEVVDLKNEEFKHEDGNKEVLHKQEEKKTIDYNLANKESKEDEQNILNNYDHIKILNMYNQLLLAEKRKDSILNKNTVTTSTASNSNFISDENLEKDELMRHLPQENTFKQLPSDSVGNKLEVTKSAFLEELEGSGNIENFNEPLPTSDQESSKSARILEIFSRVNDSNQCVTPKNESGHCSGLTECSLIESTENFSTFLQYMCFQKSRLVGICCPDNPVIEISDPLENSTEQVKADIQQPSEGCGLSTHTRIVGGTMSIPHEFSWMVALLRRGRFYCGGVIINNWYILTAAHCVLGIKVGDLKVRLGEFDFHKTTDHQRDFPVAEIKRHALFATLTFQHDIALLKLKRRIEYTKFIGSICLPNKDEGDFTARNATVVGWGTVSFGGAASPILHKVTVPVWDNKLCDRTYVFERINEAFMCAGSPENGEDACQGDSGGPLMTMNDDGRWSVIGIVSWGRRCGDPTYPGVYTRVTSYVDWIAENAQ